MDKETLYENDVISLQTDVKQLYVKISEGKSSTMFILPYFDHLKKSEREQVLELICSLHEDHLRMLLHSAPGDHRNGFPYVVDNLRHILALPDDGQAYSRFIKFAMLMSLRSEFFFNKQNIDLLYAFRHIIYTLGLTRNAEQESLSGGKKHRYVTLENLVMPFERYHLRQVASGARSEASWYFTMTLYHWRLSGTMTLREVLQKQVVFGGDLDLPYGHKANDNKAGESRSLGDILVKMRPELHKVSSENRDYDTASNFISLLSSSDPQNKKFLDYNNTDVEIYTQWTRAEIYSQSKNNIVDIDEFFKRYPVRQTGSNSSYCFTLIHDLTRYPDADLKGHKDEIYSPYAFSMYDTIYRLVNNDMDCFLEVMEYTSPVDFNIVVNKNEDNIVDAICEFGKQQGGIPFSLVAAIHGVNLSV